MSKESKTIMLSEAADFFQKTDDQLFLSLPMNLADVKKYKTYPSILFHIKYCTFPETDLVTKTGTSSTTNLPLPMEDANKMYLNTDKKTKEIYKNQLKRNLIEQMYQLHVEKGLNVKKVADSFGCSVQMVYAILRGEYSLAADDLYILKDLGFNITQLFGEDNHDYTPLIYDQDFADKLGQLFSSSNFHNTKELIKNILSLSNKGDSHDVQEIIRLLNVLGKSEDHIDAIRTILNGISRSRSLTIDKVADFILTNKVTKDNNDK